MLEASTRVGENPGSKLERSPSQRAWPRWVGIAYFIFASIALVHPMYTEVGNKVEPRVAGLPFSLVYVLGWIAANTLVLTALYRSRAVDSREGD